MLGNDLATLPDFPAEIRAPAGTLHGVSAFQIHFASRDILTPGDHPNVLVAMNPAALKTNLEAVERGGTVIVNEDAFTRQQPAGRPATPRTRSTTTALGDYQVFRVPMTSITVRATERIDGVTTRDAARAKNLFALGLVSWMYGRPTDGDASTGSRTSSPAKPPVRDANLAAFRAGYNFGETAELLAVHYEVKPAPAEPGTYRNINGTTAMALGLVAASVRSSLPLFYASYPITPGVGAPARAVAAQALRRAHDAGGGRDRRRQHRARRVVRRPPRRHGDERAGHGPQGGDDRPRRRARASAGRDRRAARRSVDRHADQDRGRRPLLAMYGRHGESPLPIVAASRPGQSFEAALEAVRIAVKYRTPVILLSDTFLANSSEPWRIPTLADLPDARPRLRDRAQRGRGVLALPARREPGAALGDPGHARPPAPDRRAREGGRHRQHQLRAREPRPDDPHPRRAGGEDRRRHPAARGRRTTRAPSCSCSAGARATARSTAPRAACGARASGSPWRTSTT